MGALFDLESRIDSCRTITSCILEHLPMPGQDVDLKPYVIDAGNLAAALADILDLCRDDVQRAYEQLKQVD